MRVALTDVSLKRALGRCVIRTIRRTLEATARIQGVGVRWILLEKEPSVATCR